MPQELVVECLLAAQHITVCTIQWRNAADKAGVTNVAITLIIAGANTYTFTGTSNAGSHQVVYGPARFQPATGGITIVATTSPVTLTGLQTGATYEVYVRTNCTGGGNSLYVGPVSFNTGCSAATAIATLLPLSSIPKALIAFRLAKHYPAALTCWIQTTIRPLELLPNRLPTPV